MPYYGGTPMATDPKFLMDRLMQRGMSRAQAAAVVGNLQRESGLASNNMNKDEGAYGLMQWRGPRFDALQQFAAKQGTAWTDPGTQADFIAHEMATTERKNAQGFMQARTVDEASAALKPVIRYGDESGPERAMHARNFFGAADPVAPEAAAAPPGSPPSQPPAAQPAVSRETLLQQQAYANAFGDTVGQGSNARGMRGGLNSIGDAIGAYMRNPARAQANFSRLGDRFGNALGLGGQPPAQPPVDLASHTPAAQAPPGAPEPPRFPGGIPQPRPRPMTGPGLPGYDQPIDPDQTVAGMGSLVDPMTGFDYG